MLCTGTAAMLRLWLLWASQKIHKEQLLGLQHAYSFVSGDLYDVFSPSNGIAACLCLVLWNGVYCEADSLLDKLAAACQRSR